MHGDSLSMLSPLGLSNRKPLPLGMGYITKTSTVGRTGIYAWGEHIRPNRGNARRTKNPPALAVGSVKGSKVSLGGKPMGSTSEYAIYKICRIYSVLMATIRAPDHQTA